MNVLYTDGFRTRMMQSVMTYDQISTGASVFVLYNLCTCLPIKITSLYISLFQGKKNDIKTNIKLFIKLFQKSPDIQRDSGRLLFKSFLTCKISRFLLYICFLHMQFGWMKLRLVKLKTLWLKFSKSIWCQHLVRILVSSFRQIFYLNPFFS